MRRYEVNPKMMELPYIGALGRFYTPEGDLLQVKTMNLEYNRITSRVKRGHLPTPDEIAVVDWIRDQRKLAIQQSVFIVTGQFIAYTEPTPSVLVAQFADGDTSTILSALHGRRNPLDFWEQIYGPH